MTLCYGGSDAICLTGHSKSRTMGSCRLCSQSLYGFPPGSVLGPLLYVLYTAELHQLVERHGVNLNQYADDCQLYLSTPVSGAAAAVSVLLE